MVWLFVRYMVDQTLTSGYCHMWNTLTGTKLNLGRVDISFYVVNAFCKLLFHCYNC